MGLREKFAPNDGIDQPYWKAQETNKMNRKDIYQQLQHWWRPQQGWCVWRHLNKMTNLLDNKVVVQIIKIMANCH